MIYKGVLLENVFNLVWIIGYINVLWILKFDIVGVYLCWLLWYMVDNGYMVVMLCDVQDCVLDVGMFDQLNFGYVKCGQDIMLCQGFKYLWRVFMYYEKDVKILFEDFIDDGVLYFVVVV